MGTHSITPLARLTGPASAVHAIDLLPAPSDDFARVSARAQALGTSITYHQVDVRDNAALNTTISSLGPIHGLIAAAGIQQETPALEYTPADANRMFEVNITGVFMTAQAVAKAMIRHGTAEGGSMCLIASMSGTIANKVGGEEDIPLAE